MRVEEPKTCHCCGADRAEARMVVAMTSKTIICDKCIDMLSEIAHESGGFVPVSVSELERLRACESNAHDLAWWIEYVRKAVAKAEEVMKGCAQC